MIASDALVLPQAAVDEAKAYLRIAGDDEDALIGGLMRSAAQLCERFTGQVLIARDVSETLPGSAAWTRLGRSPVRAIAGVEALPREGVPTALAVADYAVDIDANGDGWVRMIRAGDAPRVRVAFEAGMAADWAGVPEALRQGILRLTAHLHAHRDAAVDAGPPAAVTALWRPWRRMRLGGA